MKAPRVGVKLELQLPAYTTATAMQNLSPICDLRHSPWIFFFFFFFFFVFLGLHPRHMELLRLGV